MVAGQTGAAVLAAGLGSRFDGEEHKLLAAIGGVPLVDRTLSAVLASGLAPVAVVVSREDVAARVPRGFATLWNPDPAAGMAASLAIATGWAGEAGLDYLLVVLGDQPLIEAACLRALASAEESDLAIAAYAGRRGNPVRIRSTLFGRLPRTGESGARLLLGDSGLNIVEVECVGDNADVDTVADLERVSLRLLRREE